MRDRPWLAPARHWPAEPNTIAGKDQLSGGSWLGMNRAGVVAAVLNRRGSLGPQAGKRSRGELVLRALKAQTADAGARALVASNPADYRSFNLVVLDVHEAFWLRHTDSEPGREIEIFRLPQGLSILTAGDRNDLSSPRIRHVLPRFEAAPVPEPEQGDWAAWQAILAARDGPGPDEVGAAMNLDLPSGFGTVSSSLIALPEPPISHKISGELPSKHLAPLWLFAAGRPDEVPYQPINLFG